MNNLPGLNFQLGEDIDALRDFITNALQGIPAVAETSTMVVLERTSYPLAGLR